MRIWTRGSAQSARQAVDGQAEGGREARAQAERRARRNGRSRGTLPTSGLNASPENVIRFPVAMAGGTHLFPYRTQKLSLHTLMVLGWRRPGRVGRCRIPIDVGEEQSSPTSQLSLYSFCAALRLRTRRRTVHGFAASPPHATPRNEPYLTTTLPHKA